MQDYEYFLQLTLSIRTNNKKNVQILTEPWRLYNEELQTILRTQEIPSKKYWQYDLRAITCKGLGNGDFLRSTGKIYQKNF